MLVRVQVHYRRAVTEKWSNVWHVEAADLSVAESAFVTAGVPDLLPLLHNSCQIASFLVSDPLTSEFITHPVGANGTSGATGEMLPLFNSVRAFFNDGSFGRPDNKFIKGLLTEADQANGIVDPTTRSTVVTRLSTLITDMSAASAALVSVQGDPYASVSVQTEVQMRQMHRKRRRVTPAP